MGMNAAEKMRRYRLKRDMNIEKRNEYLQKERIRSTKRRKLVKDMTRREHKAQKAKWREEKRQQTEKKKAADRILTPPMSPTYREDEEPFAAPPRERQRQPRRRRQNMVLRKELASVRGELQMEKKRVEMYRKRLQRAKYPNQNLFENPEGTPKSRTKTMLHSSSKKAVRKTLLFHNVLIDAIREKYSSSGTAARRTLASVAARKLMKKYKLKSTANSSLKFYVKKRKEKTRMTPRTKHQIQAFYLRDDNTRMCTGKRKTVTSKKLKRQKRLLCGSVKQLHQRYCSDNPSEAVSYTTFWRSKPFWVKTPAEYERDTCLCKQHENFRLVIEKLYMLDVLKENSVEKVIKMATCSKDKKPCMYGKCDLCKDFDIELNDRDNLHVCWLQWKSVKQTRDIKHVGKKEVSLTVKEDVHGSLSELADVFRQQLSKMKQHTFNIVNQFLHFRQLKSALGETDCILHIDFSENYVGKMESEVQSMHYGASNQQVTLHTGMLYTSDGQQSFCTVSDSMEHGPPAIWAHLQPVLSHVRRQYPNIDTIHFFSDRPTSQYRQKSNFCLASVLPFTLGFHHLTWNFFEASHGKGAPDGIGGALKRQADKLVCFGSSIMNASCFAAKLQVAGTEVKMFTVDKEEIDKVQKHLQSYSLKPVPGTLMIHQVISESSGTIFYRDVSCSCPPTKPCEQHQCKTFTFPRKDHLSLVDADDKEIQITEDNPDIFLTNDLQQDRKKYFAYLLEDMSKCQTYEKLQNICSAVQSNLQYSICGTERSIMQTKLEVDVDSIEIYPVDVSPDGHSPMYPVSISADGNCLPHVGSLFAFGDEYSADEIRCRIVVELVTYEELYLSHDFLLRGYSSSRKVPKDFAANYAQYSEMFIPVVPLCEETIQSIFHNEVMAVRCTRSYMGIWQLHALASVLQMKLSSVYPLLGNPSVRQDLHRIIMPRMPCSNDECAQIMWTTTQTLEMTQVHWVPNHFVTVLPIDFPKDLDLRNSESSNVCINNFPSRPSDNDQQLASPSSKSINSALPHTDAFRCLDHDSSDSAPSCQEDPTCCKLSTGIAGSTDKDFHSTDPDLTSSPVVPTSNEATQNRDNKTKVLHSPSSPQGSSTMRELKEQVPSANLLTNKFVIVVYDEKPYLGKVLCVDKKK